MCTYVIFKGVHEVKKLPPKVEPIDVDILPFPRRQITILTRLVCRRTPLVHTWITARGLARSQNSTVRQSVFGLKIQRNVPSTCLLPSRIKYLYF